MLSYIEKDSDYLIFLQQFRVLDCSYFWRVILREVVEVIVADL